MDIAIEETSKRSLATEDALVMLVTKLIEQDDIPVQTGIEILETLSESSTRSKERLSKALKLLYQIQGVAQ